MATKVTIKQEDHNSKEYGYGLYINGYVQDTEIAAITDDKSDGMIFASVCLPKNASDNEIKSTEKRVRAKALREYKKFNQ
jgi:hypothetical protein